MDVCGAENNQYTETLKKQIGKTHQLQKMNTYLLVKENEQKQRITLTFDNEVDLSIHLKAMWRFTTDSVVAIVRL